MYTKDQSTDKYSTPNGKDLKKGAGVVGNQSNKLYYYGMQIQADDYKYQVATIPSEGTNYSFIVNSNGSIQHSAKTEYKEDGDVLVKTGVGADTEYLDGQFKYAIKNTGSIEKNVSDVDLGKFFAPAVEKN